MKKIDFRLVLGFVVLSGLYWWLGFLLLAEKPSVWPDEAVYAEVVENFLDEGRLGSDLWRGLIPGVERMAGWNPPAFLLALAGWTSLFGGGIAAMRSMALAMGFVAWVGVLVLAREIYGKGKSWWVMALGLALVVDFQFMRGARLARPEIMVVMLAVWSQWLWWRGVKQKSKRWWVAGGLVWGLAILAHPLAVVFGAGAGVLGWEGKGRERLWRWGDAVVGMMVAIVGWLLVIWGEWGNVANQMRLASLRKAAELTWIEQAWRGENWLFKLIITVSLVLGGWIIIKGWRSKEKAKRYGVVMVLATGLAMAGGKQFWYVVLWLPFLYLSAFGYWQQKKRGWLVVLVIGLVGLNGVYALMDGMRIKSLGLDYGEYAAAIREEVGEGRRVFLSAVPDPYFGLVEGRGQERMVEFPVYELTLEEYERVLEEMEVVVYTKDHSQVLFGTFLDDYLKANTKVAKKVEAGGYEAWVLWLVDEYKGAGEEK